jgi:hypothetical protein
MIDKAILSLPVEYVDYLRPQWTLTLYEGEKSVKGFFGYEIQFEFSEKFLTVYSVKPRGQGYPLERDNIVFRCPMPAYFEIVRPTSEEIESYRKEQAEKENKRREFRAEVEAAQEAYQEIYDNSSPEQKRVFDIDRRLRFLELDKTVWNNNPKELGEILLEIDALETEKAQLLNEIKADKRYSNIGTDLICKK